MRVAVYCRVSSDEQAKKETVRNQVEFANEYCRLRQHKLVAKYLDEGVSGTTPLEDRPQGAKLLRDAHQGKFDQVLVYRLDRLARSTRNLLQVHDELQGLGIALVSMTESFDTSSPTGKLVLTMLGAIAALERDTIAERTNLGRIRRVKDGKWPGGDPPLGYRRGPDGTVEVDESGAKVVQSIYELYADGMGALTIAKHLSSHGVPKTYARRGVKRQTHPRWGDCDIIRILANPTYLGTFRFRRRRRDKAGETIEFKVPQLVSRALWDKVALKRRRNLVRAARNSKRVYLLRGLIRCGSCGRAYVGSGRVGGAAYYTCKNRTSFRGVDEEKCSSKSLRASELEDLVWNDIMEFLQKPGAVIQKLEANLKAQMKRESKNEDEFADTAQTIAKKQKERERVLGLYRKGVITDAEVEQQLRELQGEIAALKDDQERMLGKRDALTQLRNKAINVENLLKTLKKKLPGADPETKRDLMEALVDRIVVTSKGKGDQRKAEATVYYVFDAPNGSERAGYGTPKKQSRDAKA